MTVPGESTAAQQPIISFVVPVRNDARRLERCLSSIVAMRASVPALELLVADNGSTDDSAATARRAGGVVIDAAGLNVAGVRNRAAARARGQLIAFVDADHTLDPAWALAAVSWLNEPTVGAVGAPYHAPADANWLQQTLDSARPRPDSPTDTRWLAAGNLAIRRDLFESLGGFDVQLEACEDVDLCQRVIAQGRRVVIDPRLRSVHFGEPATLKQLFFGELWRGRDNLRVSLRPPRTWQPVVGVGLTVATLAALALAVSGLFGMLVWGPLPFVLGLSMFGGAVALRAFRLAGGRPLGGPRQLLQTLAVATTYESARALALVARASHRVRRRV